jgi:hypothetical protein
MKKIFILFAFLLLSPNLARAEKPKPNSADYTIDIHVQSSRLVMECGGGVGCRLMSHLNVVINGKKLELSAGLSREDLLRVGDYKAKIAKDETTRTYEYLRTYEFLFADGQTRLYSVVGETE